MMPSATVVKYIDILSFDMYQNDNGVNSGLNGTFEHLYPDRTLIILLGRHANSSVLNYTGNTVILGGYKFFNEDDNDVYIDNRPSCNVMAQHGWILIKTIEDTQSKFKNPDRCYDHTHEWAIFIIDIYQRHF